MICDICGKKKATVHLTEIVDAQMTEMHICEDCAKGKSMQMEQQFGIADLLAGLSDFGKQVKDVEKKVVQCPSCGLTYDDFKKMGRLGCGECYSAFKQQLEVLLKKIHGSTRHLGKSPGNIKQEVVKEKKGQIELDVPETIEILKKQLQESIENEDFEKAALLRDKIRSLEVKEGKKE